MEIDKVALIKKDIELLDELMEWMNAYIWEVSACGGHGKTEIEKIETMSRNVIKVLVNYI